MPEETTTAALRIMEVKQCTAMGKIMTSPESYRSTLEPGSFYRKVTNERVVEHALKTLEELYAADKSTHEANIPAIENNKSIRDQISSLMESVGIPKQYSIPDPKSKAFIPKRLTKDSGYVEDLNRHVRISDGWNLSESRYAEYSKKYNAWAEEMRKKDEQAKAQEENQKAAMKRKREADMKLASILLRYELPIDSEWSDVLEALRQKNQRLDLAVAMMATRGDWSEGPYRVADALSRFSVGTPEDAAIFSDVSQCLNDFDDGRVFRDTDWNYDRIFASVDDKTLAADVGTAYAETESDDR